MYGTLKIEAIGDNFFQKVKLYTNIVNSVLPGIGTVTFGDVPKRYWVAEILGKDEKYKYKRCFLKGKKSYRNTNSVGSRGIFINYILESGKVYEIKKPTSWKNEKRFFCIVSDDGDIIEIDKEEIGKWLKKLGLE